MIQDMS